MTTNKTDTPKEKTKQSTIVDKTYRSSTAQSEETSHFDAIQGKTKPTTIIDEIRRNNETRSEEASNFDAIRGRTEQRTELTAIVDEIRGRNEARSEEVSNFDAIRGRTEQRTEPAAIVDEIRGRNEARSEEASNFDAIRGRTEQRTEPYSRYGEGAVASSNEVVREIRKPEVIFFGNGPLSEYTLEVLKDHVDLLFHARTAADLPEVAKIKTAHPDAFGILASFGVLIKSDILDLFQPEGILNLHPSLLPKYRGASPIESAILAGDTDFSYSIMKLVRKMDAGPIYHQTTFPNLTLDKDLIYRALAHSGAEWLIQNLAHIRDLTPTPQDDSAATFTSKLDKSMSQLQPESHSAEQILRQIIAYQGFPKPKYEFFKKNCIILKAHIVSATSAICDPSVLGSITSPLMIKCQDRNFVAVDELQPEGKKPMSAKAFMNGYGKAH